MPGESQGQRSLVGYSPWSHKESDTTECVRVRTCARAHTHTHTHTRLRLRAPNAGSKGLISGWGTKILHPRGVRPRLEGRPRTPLSSRVATRQGEDNSPKMTAAPQPAISRCSKSTSSLAAPLGLPGPYPCLTAGQPQLWNTLGSLGSSHGSRPTHHGHCHQPP